ncbi:hypothetical protein BSKO_10330 [Bryopsis sp. KO-2023]|nr:hypothetical protein BSKO_10330 [Bryopsis sp. KO-2023]
MTETNDFDFVVTDDGILSSIFGWLAAKDVVRLVVVNKRWSRVALEGPLHTPLPDAVTSVLKETKNVQEVSPEGYQPLTRFKAYCGLRVFNLLVDPYFTTDPPRFPIDVFNQCPWVVTKMGSLGTFVSIHPDNQLPGTLGEVGGLRSVAPPWPARFKNPDDLLHRVLRPNGNKQVQWTQVLSLTRALGERGFSEDVAGAILDKSPPFGLSIWVAARCPSETDVEIAFHGPDKKFPMYNTPQMDAYTKGAIFSKTFKVPSTPVDEWVRHGWVLENYPKGARWATVSFSTAPSSSFIFAHSRDISLFGSPCLLVLSDESKSAWVEGASTSV